ncbi:MAG: sigma-70 family RNA polymerase sigma factor [Dehalococcoidia bacterium]|nr:sigma-70 family RNA polymerase sigma factor [Dehalococcoidia bacterium]
MSEPPPDPSASPSRTIDREDAELLERLRRNDREALAAIYDRYGRLAFGLAYRVVGEPQEAEDTVQESFLTLWRQAGRLDAARGSVRSYLLTIVHRRAIDALRRKSGRAERALDQIEPIVSPAPDPMEVASRGEDRALVQRALAGLPSDQRQAVELAYFGGLTIAELAQEQGIPLGTAKSRLRLALKRMRQTLSAKT